MDPVTIGLLIASVVVVLAVSLIKMPWFSEKVRVAIAVGVSVVAAGVSIFLTGDFQADTVAAGALQVFALSQLIYRFILEKTGLDDKLEFLGSGGHSNDAS